MLSNDDIKKVAKLAGLTLTSEEIEKYKHQLGNIIQMVDELKELDTINTEPTSQTTGLENILREDNIDTTNMLPIEEVVSQGANIHNNYFVVPMLLKEKDN